MKGAFMTEPSAAAPGQAGQGRPVTTVAMIGVGSMGDPMARRIRAAGFGLTVCDANPANVKPFAEAGANVAAKPSGCAACDAVIVLVATPEQLRAVALGEDGLRSGTGGGPSHLVVMSTVSPGDMRDLAASFAGGPTRVVDAPVSGGVLSAQEGTLTVMAGGADTDVAALRPLFEAMGRTVFHCGPLGAGQATKIVNNVIAISNLMISAEAYRIALQNGLTLDCLVPVLDASSARNFLSRSPLDAQQF